MAKSKKFAAPPSRHADANGEPGMPIGAPSMDLTFNAGSDNEATFKVRGQMRGIRVLNVMRALEGDNVEGMSAGANIYGFLEFAFLKENREEAMEYLSESEPEIDFNVIIDIVTWLVQEYTGNPTERRTQSEAGSSTTGSGPSVTPPSEGSISEPSTANNSGQLQPT